MSGENLLTVFKCSVCGRVMACREENSGNVWSCHDCNGEKCHDDGNALLPVDDRIICSVCQINDLHSI